MASLAKVLRKAGFLNPVAMNLQKFIDKQNQRSNQAQFNELMQTAFGEIMKSGTEEGESTFTPGETTSRMSDLLPRLGTRTGDAPTGGAVDDPNQPGINILDQPEDEILGDVTKRTPDEQRMNVQQSQFDALLEMSKLEGLDPAKRTEGQQLLELLGKSVTPKQVGKTYKSVALGSDLFEIGDDGSIKLIREGTQKAKVEKSIGSYTGEDGRHHITLYDPETQTTREIISENKVRPPRGLKIDFPKPEKWKNFGSVMNGIYYKTDDLGNIVETNEQEQKVLRELAQNKVLGNMLPNATNFLKNRIWNVWNRENMSQIDFEEEINQGIDAGEISPEEAQDLLDYNAFRPFLYDDLIETVERNPEE